MEIKPVTVKVATGNFYVEDAKFYHYSQKGTALLEDITEYSYLYPGYLSDISGIEIVNCSYDPFPFGYGSSYSLEYGGVFRSNQDGTRIKLKPRHSSEKLFIPTADMYARINADVREINPVADLLNVSSGEVNVDGTNEVRQYVDISYRKVIPDFFHKNEKFASGETFNVRIAETSPFDASGELVAENPSKNYSFSIASSNEYALYSDILAWHASGEAFRLDCADDSMLSYTRVGDIIECEFPIKYLEVFDIEQIPTNKIQAGTVYHLKDLRSPSSYNHFVRKLADGSVQETATAPILQPVKIRLRVAELNDVINDGVTYSGTSLYVKWDDWEDPYFFDNHQFEFINQLISFWGGFPSTCILNINQLTLTIDTLDGNRGYIKGAEIYGYYRDTNIDLSWAISDPTITLLGTADLYTEGIEIPFYLFEKKIILPKETLLNKRVVITDWLASEKDLPNSLGVEYRINRDREIEINRVQNLLNNPTFLQTSGEFVDGWYTPNASNEAYPVLDSGRIDSVIHERSYVLSEVGAKVYCLVPNVDVTQDLSLTFYAKGSSTLQVKYYGLDNQGTFLKSIAGAVASNELVVKTIPYTQTTLGTSFVKYTTRLIQSIGSIPEMENEIALEDNTDEMPSNITDILVEFSKVSGTGNSIISAPQLEYSLFPGPYSHDYDLGLVEYELSEDEYSPRFVVSSLDNPVNSGYLALDVYANDIDDSYDINAIQKSSIRRAAYTKFKSKIYAKESGINKWIQVSKFALDRTLPRKEHFVKPEIYTPASISIVGDPVYIQQSTIYQKIDRKPVNLVLEDENGKNIVGQNVEVRFGFIDGVLNDIRKVSAHDDGIIRIIPPEIYQESIYRYGSFAPSDGDTLSEYPLFMPIPNDGTSPEDYDEGTVFCFVYNDATISRLYVTTTAITTGTFLDQGVNYELLNSSDPNIYEDTGEIKRYIWKLPSYSGVPAGYVAWPTSCPYTIDMNSLDSIAMSYFSAFDNKFQLAKKVLSGTTTALFNNVESDNDYTKFLIPQSTYSIDFRNATITNYRHAHITYSRSNSIHLQSKGYFFNADTGELYINDKGCDRINIEYKPRMAVTVTGNDLYIHRAFLVEPFQYVRNRILSSSSYMAIPGIMTAGSPAWKDFTFYMKPYINIEGYMTASLGSISSSSTIIYTHTKLN